VILHTDWTDFTELHGESIKKSVFIRVIRVQNVLITAIPNEPNRKWIQPFRRLLQRKP
jgi:hypothetical protein